MQNDNPENRYLQTIADTVEVRGDVDIITLPLKEIGYYFIDKDAKYIFLSKNLAPTERENLIQTGLEMIKNGAENNSVG